MERVANNLDQAKDLFGQNDEPVKCQKEGADEVTANTLAEAEAYFAD